MAGWGILDKSRGDPSSWSRGLPRKYKGKVDSKRRRLLLESRLTSQLQRKSQLQEAAPPLGVAVYTATTQESQLQEGTPPLGVAVCLANTKESRRIDNV